MTVDTVLIHGACGGKGTLYTTGGAPLCTSCGAEDAPMWSEFDPDPGVIIAVNSNGDIVAREES